MIAAAQETFSELTFPAVGMLIIASHNDLSLTLIPLDSFPMMSSTGLWRAAPCNDTAPVESVPMTRRRFFAFCSCMYRSSASIDGMVMILVKKMLPRLARITLGS
jgi:hypothetical protein